MRKPLVFRLSSVRVATLSWRRGNFALAQGRKHAAQSVRGELGGRGTVKRAE